MNKQTALAHAANAQRGSLTDLGALLRGVVDGQVPIDAISISIGGTEVTATAAELNKLAESGAVVASGTQEAFQSDLGDSASGAQIATAVNGLRDALVAFNIMAAS